MPETKNEYREVMDIGPTLFMRQSGNDAVRIELSDNWSKDAPEHGSSMCLEIQELNDQFGGFVLAELSREDVKTLYEFMGSWLNQTGSFAS